MNQAVRAVALTLSAAEETGSYGRLGELCAPCPKGGYCNGSLEDPVSLGGWWMMNVSAQAPAAPAPCAEDRQGVAGADCFVAVPCEPADACVGLNLCSPA